MKSRTRTLVLAAGVTVTLATSGVLSAWAAWTTGATPGRISATAAQIPTPNAPHAKLSDTTVEISWDAPTTLPLTGYVVLRDDGTATTTVCNTAGTTRSCVDKNAPVATVLHYSVRAALGPKWLSPASKLGNAVRIPSPPGQNRQAGTPATQAANPTPTPPQSPQPISSPTASPTPTGSLSPTGNPS